MLEARTTGLTDEEVTLLQVFAQTIGEKLHLSEQERRQEVDMLGV